MKSCIIVTLCLVLLSPLFSQSKLNFNSVLLKTEQYPYLIKKARNLAVERNLPISIFIKGKAFIQPVIVENDKVLYSVITNLLHPFKDGYLATFDEIESSFNLNDAKVRYFEDKIINTEKVYKGLTPGDSLYLIPETTNDRVMAFSAIDGDTIDLNFIIPHITNDTLNLPCVAKFHPVRNTIVVSDQVKDVIQEFDTSGIFFDTFAPAGGQNTSILDNVRGMAFHPNDNLLVTVGYGTNQDAIAEFDLFGNYVGNIISPNDTIMDSPFDVFIKTNDILVSAINNDVIARYDLLGNYLDYFATGVEFPEQIAELSSSEIAVANFSNPNSGIQIYPASGGSYTELLTGITGNRGVAELSNGNLIATNSGGVHIIDRLTGNLDTTIVSGVSARFISLYIVGDPQNTPTFSVFPNIVDFGIIMEDSSKSDTLIVYNTSNTPLLISSVLSDNLNFIVNPEAGIVAVNDSTIFEVTCTAGIDSGLQNANIVFNHNAQSSPDTVEVIANILTNLNNLEKTILNSFFLSQNYPNPFNPTTNISFSLPTSENVELKIYNINGQEIETVLNKQFAAGEYHLKYTATSLSSGIYIYTIKAGNFKLSHKMILIK